MFKQTSRKSLCILLLVAVTLSLGLLSSRAKAETQATGWKLQQVDKNGRGRAALALDTSSRPHVAYYGADNLGQHGLKYAFFDGTTWNIEMVDSNTNAAYTSIAVDRLDRPQIVYYDSRSKDLQYAIFDIDWALSVIDSSGDVGRSPDIQVDSLSLPHVAYWDATNEAVKYAWFDGTTWNKSTVDDMSDCNGYAPTISLALGPSDQPYISYSSCKTFKLKYAYKSSGGWVSKVVDPNSENVHYSDIAVDSEGGIHIGYRSRGLKYAYKKGSGWSFLSVDGNFLAGNFISIGIDSSFRPHFSYTRTTRDGEEELRHAYNDGFGWKSEKLLVHSDLHSFDNTSLVVSSKDKLFLAFWDGEANDVEYATSKVQFTIVHVYLPFTLSVHK